MAAVPSRTPTGDTSKPASTKLQNTKLSTPQEIEMNEDIHRALYHGLRDADRQKTVPPVASARCNSRTSFTTSCEPGVNQSKWSMMSAWVRDFAESPVRTLLQSQVPTFH